MLEQTRKDISEYLVNEDNNIYFDHVYRVSECPKGQENRQELSIFACQMEFCAVLCLLDLIAEASSASCRSRVNFVAGIVTGLA